MSFIASTVKSNSSSTGTPACVCVPAGDHGAQARVPVLPRSQHEKICPPYKRVEKNLRRIARNFFAPPVFSTMWAGLPAIHHWPLLFGRHLWKCPLNR